MVKIACSNLKSSEHRPILAVDPCARSPSPTQDVSSPMFDNLTVRNKFLVVGLVPAPCFIAIAVLGFIAGSATIGGIAIASAVLTALVAFRVGTRAADRVGGLTERLTAVDVDIAGGGIDEPAHGEPAADEIGAAERAAYDLVDRVAAAQENYHFETTARTRSLLHAAAAESKELVGHQLDAIDWLEAREDDSARLERMFRLDHVAARLHRNAARLLVLAGDDSIHSRSTPAPMADVIRVAMGEMEDFARIELRTLDDVMIAPTAACEVAQLLSELLANSLAGSVDDTPIEIHATHLDDGSYSVTIIDRGSGMTADGMATAQARVETPAEIGDLPDHRIGLNVVGRLARHLGATIDFSETAGSGVTVDLRLPVELVAAATVVGPISTKYSEVVRDTDEGTTPQSWTPPATPLRTSEKQDRVPKDRVPKDRVPKDRVPKDRVPPERPCPRKPWTRAPGSNTPDRVTARTGHRRCRRGLETAAYTAALARQSRCFRSATCTCPTAGRRRSGAPTRCRASGPNEEDPSWPETSCGLGATSTRE